MKPSATSLCAAILTALAVPVLAPCDSVGQNLGLSSWVARSGPVGQQGDSDSAASVSPAIRLPSASKAAYISLASTVIPVSIGVVTANSGSNPAPGLVLVGSALILGPATGFIYGGCTNRGLDGIQIRLLTAGVTLLLAGVAYNSNGEQEHFMDFSNLEAVSAAGAIGAGIVAIEALYDLGRVKTVVDEQNQKRLRASPSLGPVLTANGTLLALGVRVRF